MLLSLSISPLSIVLISVGSIIGFLASQVVYFFALHRWADKKTLGLNYYGRSLENRRRFKQSLSSRTMLAQPLLWLASRLIKVNLNHATFVYEGVAGPKDACNVQSFRSAAHYRPSEQDVFVVTQMKCGTTWMQHLVYQVLLRGKGDLVETGRALYSISPWIESIRSVSIDDAPLVQSNQPKRVIKTHLPTSLCPFSNQAKYIYVARHPVSCFASVVDFVGTNAGPFDITLQSFEAWFCSNKMWWGTWPDHVAGWWHLSKEKPNVLFVHFEEMKSNLPMVTRRVADFLSVADLSPSEFEQILFKCSFEYMKKNSESFEMAVPTVFQSGLSSTSFVSGKINRYKDMPQDVNDRIIDWCQLKLEGNGTTLDEIYPAQEN